jgi:apolipoprotein N-acyltransferase
VQTRPLHASVTVGLVFGASAYAGGFHSLWHLVDTFLQGNRAVGVGLWLAYGAWFAAAFGLYAGLVRTLRRRGGSPAVAGIAPLVGVEWLYPQLFPVYAGSALAVLPRWSQPADLGGPLLLTALVAGANVVAGETAAWGRGRRPRPLLAWSVGLSVALATLGYGHVRTTRLAATVRDAPTLEVGLVQAHLAWDDAGRLGIAAHRSHLALTAELLAAGALDLVVWPESAYVHGIRRPLPVSGRAVLGTLDVPLLFGGSSVRQHDGRRVKHNSAFLVGADGMIRDAYDKNLLIPLAEHVPAGAFLPDLTRWFPEAGQFRAAHATPALRLGAWRLATPICYEAIRPAFVRRMVATGRPHLLVTLASDAYFGDSQEPHMHLALARLRAVEHRRFLVRATGSGVSAIVDPTGRIVAHTALGTRATLRATVALLDGGTVYGRLGDWPGAVAVLLVAWTWVRRRRDLTPRHSLAARSPDPS